MKKNRVRLFKNDASVFSTPDVFDEDGSRVGSVRIFLNIYGDMVAEMENRHFGTGYYSQSMNCVCADLDDDTLIYYPKCSANMKEEIIKYYETKKEQ